MPQLPKCAADLPEKKKTIEGETVTFFIDGQSFTKTTSEALVIANSIITLVGTRLG